MRGRVASAAVFLAVMVIGGAVLLSDPVQAGVLHGLSVAIARVSARVLGTVGFAVEQRQQVIGTTDGLFRVSVENDCNGAWAHLILLASVLAYPARTRDKLMGLLVMQPALFVVNVVRIVSLFLVGLYALPLFRPTHVYVWQVLIVGCAIALFLGWVERGAEPAA